MNFVTDDKGSGGTVLWLRLGWYPIQLLMYAAGVAAVDANNYEALAKIMLTPVNDDQRSTGAQTPLVIRISGAMSEINDAFKRLPGRDREFVPRSEYFFTLLRDPLENELLLGSNYEALFDRFEVLTALIYADLTYESRGGWGPIGRFGWKSGRGNDGGPYAQIAKEIEQMGAAGLL